MEALPLVGQVLSFHASCPMSCGLPMHNLDLGGSNSHETEGSCWHFCVFRYIFVDIIYIYIVFQCIYICIDIYIYVYTFKKKKLTSPSKTLQHVTASYMCHYLGFAGTKAPKIQIIQRFPNKKGPYKIKSKEMPKILHQKVTSQKRSALNQATFKSKANYEVFRSATSGGFRRQGCRANEISQLQGGEEVEPRRGLTRSVSRSVLVLPLRQPHYVLSPAAKGSLLPRGSS